MRKFVDNTSEHFEKSKKRCRLVETRDEAHRLMQDLGDEFGLDFETTALSPLDGEIRLTSVCNDDTHFLIDHFFLGPFSDYVDYLVGKRVWVYNGKFEQFWIDHHRPEEDIQCWDIDFAKKAKMGGAPSKLAWMAKDIGVVMDKEEQRSDWSRPNLTQSQLDYAGFDSHVTWELKKFWWDNELNDAQRRGFHVFNDAVRATVEAEQTGLILDAVYHAKTVELWKRKQATFYRYIRKWTPESIIKNVGSNKQLGDFLKRELHPDLIAVWPQTAKTKQLQVSNSYLKSVARRLPYPMSRWMAAVAGYRYYAKYLSTYGDTLLNKQALSGKITSRFNIAQAQTGRYSSSNSNLQNIPRKPVVRKAFYTPRPGERLMVLADYSGIEIRVLAELSGDKQLLEDTIYGDVHSASAAQIYGEDYDHIREVIDSKGEGRFGNIYPVFKEYRSKAKGFTFQLLYGAGAGALSDVLHCTFDEANEAIAKWAERYPQAYAYRQKMFDIMNETGFLPVCDGRTIFVWKNDRSMPVAANYPIQGAAASVMYRAMYRVRERFLDHNLDAFIAATVHDELLSYAHAEHAEEAMAQQLKGMEEGWLDIFPGTNTANLSDWAIGTSWADKP